MRRYLYCYQTAVSFSEPVSAHALLLRCQPFVGEHQMVEEEHLVVPPDCKLRRATDAFGNRILYGALRAPHRSLVYVSTGIVSTSDYQLPQGRIPVSAYLQPTRLTFLSEELGIRSEELGIEGEELGIRNGELGIMSKELGIKSEELCHQAHSLLSYMPFSTDTNTTAAEALRKGQGVCQDYAHVMIALCRCHGVPARYACGFIEGEGQTHAWVETFDGYAWHAYDPTHDRIVQDGYVKLAHGRDAADCPVSRGVYRGNAMEQTQITVTLKEI